MATNDHRQEAFGFFLVHARAHPAPNASHRAIDGRMEDLRTGQQVAFHSTAELSRYFEEWGGVRRGDERFMPPTNPHPRDGEDR